jgi:predicted acetyltransferase
VAVDINHAAVRCAGINALLNHLEHKIDVRHGDLFAPVSEERFDLILFNPPFVQGAPQNDRDRAWRSNDVAERFAAGLAAHLKPAGFALVLLSTFGDGHIFLEEFRKQGFATQLLAEAQRRMASDGSVLALARTKIPRFFHRSGWALCGRHAFSHAKARDVMGTLQVDFAGRLANPLSIRLWRHVEMPALMRIYRQNTAGGFGAFERSEAYWRWLIGRKAYDALLVALDGPDKLELEESIAPIVGYAVLRQERVVELMTTPGHPTANYQLLARAAREVIEHDRQDLVVSAPPSHPAHRVMSEAGGSLCHQEADSQQEVYMVKVVDPLKFLTMICPELESRAKQAGLARETELGLCVDCAKWRLVYTRRGMRVRGGSLGRSYLTMNRAEFTRLVLGHGSVRETAFAGRIQASTQTALDLADALFPRLPLYRPVWDELGA